MYVYGRVDDKLVEVGIYCMIFDLFVVWREKLLWFVFGGVMIDVEV